MFVLAAQAATVPTKPTITVGTPTSNTLTINLTTPSTEGVFGIDGYDIERSLDGGLTWDVVVKVVDLPYILGGLAVGTTYQLRTRGVSLAAGAYRSAPSAVVIAATVAARPVWNSTPQTLAFTAGNATPPLLLTSFVTDPQGQPLTISAVTALPPGMSLAGNSLIGTPSLAGTYTVIWKATNTSGLAANSPSWTISVSPAAAQAPVWDPNTRAFIFQTGQPITPLDLSPYVSDPGGLALTITLLSGALPVGLTLAANKITGTPTAAGSFTPTFKAKNSANLSANSPAWTMTAQTALPPARRIYADWGIAISPSQSNSRPQDAPASFVGIPNGGHVTGTYVPGSTTGNKATGAVVSNLGPVCSGVSYVTCRHNWGGLHGLDNGDGTYNWAYTDAEIAQARALNVGVYFVILTRTFNVTVSGFDQNPAPVDLATNYCEIYTGNNTGYQIARWSPTVLRRFQQFIIALGARYDLDPNFAGVGTQETSTGSAVGGAAGNYTVSLGALGNFVGQDKYDSAGFTSALQMERRIIGTACPHARELPYNNFINNDNTNAALLADALSIAIVAQQYGAMWGFPDSVTDQEPGNIVGKVYPTVQKYHLGTNGIAHPGLTFGAIQPAEWTAQNPAQNPAVAFPPGPLNPSLKDLYNWLKQTNTYPTSLSTGARDHSPTATPVSQRSPLNVDSILADYRPVASFGGTLNFGDLFPIIQAHPILRTVTPNP